MARSHASRSDRSLAAQNLKHHNAARRTFAFDCLATILHGFLNRFGNFLLGFAFYTISFRHKSVRERALKRAVSFVSNTLRADCSRRQLVKVEIPRNMLIIR